MAMGLAHGKIQDQKKDNILNLLDSVLRRNKEGEDDDVILGGEDEPVVTKDIFGYDSVANRARIDYYFNR